MSEKRVYIVEPASGVRGQEDRSRDGWVIHLSTHPQENPTVIEIHDLKGEATKRAKELAEQNNRLGIISFDHRWPSGDPAPERVNPRVIITNDEWFANYMLQSEVGRLP